MPGGAPAHVPGAKHEATSPYSPETVVARQAEHRARQVAKQRQELERINQLIAAKDAARKLKLQALKESQLKRLEEETQAINQKIARSRQSSSTAGGQNTAS